MRRFWNVIKTAGMIAACAPFTILFLPAASRGSNNIGDGFMLVFGSIFAAGLVGTTIAALLLKLFGVPFLIGFPALYLGGCLFLGFLAEFQK